MNYRRPPRSRRALAFHTERSPKDLCRNAGCDHRILDWLGLRKVTMDICRFDLTNGELRLVDVDAEFTTVQEEFRAGLLETFSMLYVAAGKFHAAGEDLENLYPQYLQEHGYLDPALGHEKGKGYRWIQGRQWIAQRAAATDIASTSAS